MGGAEARAAPGEVSRPSFSFSGGALATGLPIRGSISDTKAGGSPEKGLRPPAFPFLGDASQEGEMSKEAQLARKLKVGECRRTKAGVKYCRTRKGVRFVKG